MTNTIVDQFNRPMRDLRISVTDRCQFRCSYCMPKEVFGDDYQFLEPHLLLSFDEIERVARAFVALGVRKIRLTGGEPLMRKGLVDLIRRLNDIDGLDDIGLTTNAMLLYKQHAQALYDAGLKRLNISLDALDDSLFRELNGRGIGPQKILENIDHANEIGFHIKINMVVQKGVNEQEIVPMAQYFKDRGMTLRFIEFMDVGNDNGWSFEKVVTKKEIVDRLAEHFDLEPVDKDYFGEVASRYRYQDTQHDVGFITSVSESFCSSCTRIRLSSDGKLFNCLFAVSGRDLRGPLRNGIDDEELASLIKNNWESRTDRYSDERVEQRKKRQNKKINMSYIGG
ncbi:GTP 3',8-cyclase MoaA [Alkalibacillus salilacus]|uniref:GTP 3',8-cyclase n=1 Tax=Alkalibacillus salilacus TaxID=284582 RepID=A0ABT9VBC7_9BACI|nr:GTP 3',8-cyclase MoaA [Alkalibacillus salilacus]MDQ0158275.1 cyclic pyranopterin phosphate synthase [Alkalibacillus salilacus]